MKNIFLIIAIIAVMIGTLVFIKIYREKDCGTIVWSQTSNPSTSYEGPRSVATDGTHVYVVGSHNVPRSINCQWRIEKRKFSDGTLVENFGANGVVISSPSLDSDLATSLSIDAKYLYVIGRDGSPRRHESQWRIEKRNLSDGSFAQEFGAAGVVTSDPTSGYDVPLSIVIDARYMYVVGHEEVTNAMKNPTHRSDRQWRIEKRNLSDGSLVPHFGNGGVVRSNPNTVEGNTRGEGAHGIALDSNFMYIVGQAYCAPPSDLLWRIEKRRLSDGLLVAEFGENGVITDNPSPASDEAHAIAIDAPYMYVVGHDRNTTFHNDMQWRIEKRNLSDGRLVDEFGKNGVVTVNQSYRIDWAHAIVLDTKPSLLERIVNLDPFGNRQAMYVAGKDESPGFKDQQWRIEKRRLTDGTLVSNFGNGGVSTINPSKGFDSPSAIVADTDYIYIIGDDKSTGPIDTQWRIVKIKK